MRENFDKIQFALINSPQEISKSRKMRKHELEETLLRTNRTRSAAVTAR